MIKRIYYYFKFKELLKMEGLMPFVEYLMRIQQRSMFRTCMRNAIRWWPDYIAGGNLLRDAQRYSEYNAQIAQAITKRFRQVRDFWIKTNKKL